MSKLVFIPLVLISSISFGQPDLQKLYDSARRTSNIELAKKVNQAARKNKDTRLTANSHYLIAYLQKVNESFYQATASYFDALEAYRSLNDKEQIANVIENIANIYSKTGFHDTALNYYYDALAIKQAINDTRAVNKLNAHIAFQYQQLGKHDDAIKLYESTIEDAKQANDTIRLYWVYNNLGRLYRIIKKYPEAFISYQKALEFSYSLDDKVGIYNNIGYLYLCSGDTATAYTNLKKGLKLLDDENTEESDFIGTIYSNLGSIYAGKEADSALLFFEKSFSFFQRHQIAMSEEYFEVCKKLKEINREKGNLNEALKYSDNIDHLTADLLELRINLNDMYNQYQVEAATYKFASEEKARALARQLEISQYIKWALAVLAATLVTLLVLLYRKNRKIQFAQDTARKIYKVIHS